MRCKRQVAKPTRVLIQFGKPFTYSKLDLTFGCMLRNMASSMGPIALGMQDKLVKSFSPLFLGMCEGA